MILTVLGTHPQPFPRAARLASELARQRGEELRVQHGWTDPVPDVAASWRRWYTRAELTDAMREASVVVVHGGSGCIYHALTLGIRPLVVPRLARYGEHVDDHQLQICARLASYGSVVAWHDHVPVERIEHRLSRAQTCRLREHPDLRPSVWAAARPVARRAPTVLPLGAGPRREAVGGDRR